MAKRCRAFAAVVYPESAPENWRDILDDQHISWAESPLHNLDVNPDGEIKKLHWHIALAFDGVKTIDQIKEILEPLNCTIPVPLNSLRGYIRYMAHLDNPEKHQYPVDQIVSHGGLDVQDLLRPSSSCRYASIRDMCDYVALEGITEFYQLMDYASQYRYEDWYPLLCDSCSYIVNQYIKSNRLRGSTPDYK